jgi:PAS domain S-box-containing protein
VNSLSEQPEQIETQKASHIFPGESEMARRMRDFDWSQTQLGPSISWPQSLQTAIRLMLNSRYPMFIWWGPELINFYNDDYIPVLGARHPRALGQPAPGVWVDIWDVVGPQAEAVMHESQTTWNESVLLVMERYGYTEETYFSWSYSPVMDEDGRVRGVFCVCTEDTKRVLGERRLRTLRALAEQSTQTKNVEDACAAAIATMAENPCDLPFAMLYLLDTDGASARLVGVTMPGSLASPAIIELGSEADGPWPLSQVIKSGKSQIVSDLEREFGSDITLPGGAWVEPARQAVVLPLVRPGQTAPSGFLISGVSPRLMLDDDYQGFLELTAGQIAAAVANARAYEEERKRAEALAELDRAKTAFFSNVSHEFRTPLTLMLGPLEDTLAHSDGRLPPEERKQIELVHRNGQRLLKLVNTLLDFSRLEAGRQTINFQPTDLGELTVELASNFRAGIERAGMRLIVNCPPLSQKILVDHEMWEKIVLNLISNAFKYTIKGEIEVSLTETADAVELRVRDTGVGIPAADLTRIFERFYRVRSTQGRTHEGTGIGLSLVQELVRMHDGAIEADSELGQGSTFTVKIPKARMTAGANLMPRRSASASLAAGLQGQAFVEEALGWLPGEDVRSAGYDRNERVAVKPAEACATNSSAHVLLADDNSDMREYMRRLLGERYEVEAVADGEAALAAVRKRQFDLVLTDVMMPRLDGFGLLAAIRADEKLKTMPVILLSARAGEEAKVEGMEAGADDYLIKPFSAKDLLAHVTSRLEIARLRRAAEADLRASQQQLATALKAVQEGERRYRTLFETIDEGFCIIEFLDGPHGPLSDYVHIEANPAYARHAGIANVVGQKLREMIPGEADDWIARYRPVLETGRPIRFEQMLIATGRRLDLAAFRVEPPERRQVAVLFTDITARWQAESALRESEEKFRLLISATSDVVYRMSADWREMRYLDGKEFIASTDSARQDWTEEYIPAEERPRVWAAIRKAIATGSNFELEHQVIRLDGSTGWAFSRAVPVLNQQGEVVEWFGAASDITERRQAEADARFLTELTEHIRLAAAADSLLRDVARQVGEHLHVARCCFVEIDVTANRGVVRHEFCSGVVSVAGEYRLSDYSPETLVEMEAGRSIINRDAQSDLRTAAWYERTYRPAGERAYIAVPLRRGERWAATLWVSVEQPRDWTAREVELLETAAERTWNAVEKLRLDANLRESEERFRQMADHAPVMIWVTGANAACTYLSKSWYEFTGHTPETGLGFGWLAAVHPDDREDSRKIFFDSSERHEPFRLEYRLRRHDGEYRWAIDSAVPRLGHTGEFLGYIGSVIDIAERKRMEEALREADRRKDEFLAMLAHELRNPLAPIRNAAQAIKLAGPANADQQWAREVIERQTQHLTRLVDDLLDVSRITRGKVALQREPLDLATIINRAVETSRPLIDKHHHQFDIVLPAESLRVEGDLTRLVQVFGNLLNNAAKFTDEGGYIRLEAGQEGGEAVIRVLDNGMGLPADLRPHVFDLFTQADHSLDRSQGGLGIGLTLVRSLVELHGGKVEARSEGAGKGSEFIVRLPVLRTADCGLRIDDASNTPHSTLHNPQLRVLVVEDNLDSAEMMAFILRLDGHQVRLADGGLAALDAAHAFQPQVVLCDIGLPDMNGYDVARRLREQPDFEQTRLIALTGYGQEEARRRAKEAGFDYHLVKPVEPETLSALLSSIQVSLP